MDNQKIHVLAVITLAIWLCLLLTVTFFRERSCPVNLSGSTPHLQRMANILYCFKDINDTVALDSSVDGKNNTTT